MRQLEQHLIDLTVTPIGPHLCDLSGIGLPKIWHPSSPYHDCRSPFFSSIAPKGQDGGEIIQRNHPAQEKVDGFASYCEENLRTAAEKALGSGVRCTVSTDRPVLLPSGEILFVLYPEINGIPALMPFADHPDGPLELELFKSGPVGFRVALSHTESERAAYAAVCLFSEEALREAHVHLIEKFAKESGNYELLQDNMFSDSRVLGSIPHGLNPTYHTKSPVFEVFLRIALRAYALEKMGETARLAEKIDIDSAIESAFPLAPSDPKVRLNGEYTRVRATIVRGVEDATGRSADHWQSVCAVATSTDSGGIVSTVVKTICSETAAQKVAPANPSAE